MSEHVMSDDQAGRWLEECRQTMNLAEQAREWVRGHVSRSEGQQSGLSKIRDQLRLIRRLGQAASRRPCAAVFGASQAGKSYLVSNLLKGSEADSLTLVVPGSDRKLDFISDINPYGGQESTGLVTRFTIHPDPRAGMPPFRLSLLTQADLVKIISFGFFSDLTQKNFQVDQDRIQSVLSELRQYKSGASAGGFEGDEAFDLKEYFREHFGNEAVISDLTRIRFWESAAEILPFVPGEQRFRLFQFLWGELPVLTELFNKLSTGLQALGYSTEAFCGLEALTPKTREIQGETLGASIIDVRVLKMMFADQILEPVAITGANGAPAYLSRSVISGLTAEIALVLPSNAASGDRLPFLKDVDVLDFPGAKSHQKIAAGILKTLDAGAKARAVDLFLRSKVEFLFENYAHFDEITSLMLCLPYEPPEVMSIPHIIAKWVFKTHGAEPEERQGRDPSLFVVFTKFNIELQGKPGQNDASSHNDKWNARIKSNFHDFLSKPITRNWIEEWTPGKGFQNCFLLRDPAFSTSFFDGLDPGGLGRETGLKPGYVSIFDLMKTSFLAHPWVVRHVSQAEEAWEAVAGPNRTGVDFLIRRLGPTCHPVVKHRQLALQLEGVREELVEYLRQFYDSSDRAKEEAKARENTQKILRAFMDVKKSRKTFGLFLDSLLVSDDLAWKVFFDVDDPVREGEEDEVIEADPGPGQEKLTRIFGDVLGLDTGRPAESGPRPDQPQHRAKALKFAQRLVEAWFEELNSQTGRGGFFQRIGLEPDVLAIIVSELRRSMTRVNLVDRIATAVDPQIDRPKQEFFIDLVARLGAVELNRFVCTLGWHMVAPQDRPRIELEPGQKRPIFSNPEAATPKSLKLDVDFPGLDLLLMWLLGLTESIKANLEHAFGQARFDAAANERLGRILKGLSKKE